MDYDLAFTTLHLPAAKRVPRWTEAASDRFVESGFRVREPERFVASMLHRDLGELSVTRVLSAGHGLKQVTRSQRQAARAAEDFFLISVQLEGRCRLTQGGRDTWLAPGEFAFYDTRRPYELQLEDDYEQAVLRVPVSALGRGRGDAEGLHALALPADGAPARRLAAAVRQSCADRRAPGARAQSDELLGALRDGLRALRGEAATTPARSRSEQRARLKALITEQLADPGLSVPRIAAALGLSVSYLHQLFRGEGLTLERWIWSQRLAACERALSDPAAAARSITEIAYAHGFGDAAHFSRSFQRRYGTPPRDYRRLALAATPSR